MFTIEEQLIGLRNVGIFAMMPEHVLIRAAETLTPLVAAADQPIFMKGDPGDSLYIIAEGQVRVHDGDLQFNLLYRGDVFGEMSVLDSEPRSASVTAVVETRLYWLSQASLYRLMGEHVEIAFGVIHVLSSYLRARMVDQLRDFSYIRQVTQLTLAAEALEAGSYTGTSIGDVTGREDALGNLARVFERMAGEVYAREQKLKQQVSELRIEIDRSRQAKQVAEITETDYFKSLQQRAKALRER
ncbi:MAG: cyclic nucleotide-binding domain-containing protein [Roseiflexaceae bacterium]|nr:cyclic nucleotide-binding domain-containing protein [Roseiflexaceae bacterium]